MPASIQALLRTSRTPCLSITCLARQARQPSPLRLTYSKCNEVFALRLRPRISRRCIHVTPVCNKKKDKQNQGTTRKDGLDAQPSGPKGSTPDDSLNSGSLEISTGEILDRLRSNLRQINTGGQLKQEDIEAVQVKLKANDETVRLSDLARVVPKSGRTISIVVGQQEHVKFIIAAVLKQLEVNPVPSTYDPLDLNVSIPPPTRESRTKAQQRVTEIGERALQAVRQARAVQQKHLRTLEVSKASRPDDLRKASKKMEEHIEKTNVEVKSTIEKAKKAMERA